MVTNSSVVLDTNIAVGLLNNNSVIKDKTSIYNLFYLPFIVCGELLYGAANSSKSKANMLRFKEFISSCLLLHSNDLIVEQYVVIRKQLKEKGRPIPENDLWIAATCIVNELALLTLDKHFKFVKGLELIK